MHVTLNIPDNLIAEVQKFSGEQPQAKALTTAMKEFIKQKKINELMTLKGKVQLFNVWRLISRLLNL